MDIFTKTCNHSDKPIDRETRQINIHINVQTLGIRLGLRSKYGLPTAAYRLSQFAHPNYLLLACFRSKFVNFTRYPEYSTALIICSRH